MRKVVMLAVAAAVLSVAAVAYAQTQENTYSVKGSVTPAKAGSTKKPVGVKVGFNYQIGEKNTLAPSAVKRYKISIYGVRAPNGDKFAKCSGSDINNAGNSNVDDGDGSHVRMG